MSRAFVTAASAAALSALLLGSGPVLAQEQQLNDATRSGVSALGIDPAPIAMLPPDKVAQIENVLGSSDDTQNKIDRINLIIGEPAASVDAGGLGVRQLQDSISNGMAQLGVDTAVIPLLTVGQLAEVEGVLSSSLDEQQRRAQIESIIGDNASADQGSPMGVARLRDSASSAMAQLGIDTASIDMLTLGQLGEIENVAASGDDDVQKRDRIERILAN